MDLLGSDSISASEQSKIGPPKFWSQDFSMSEKLPHQTFFVSMEDVYNHSLLPFFSAG